MIFACNNVPITYHIITIKKMAVYVSAVFDSIWYEVAYSYISALITFSSRNGEDYVI